MTKGEKLQSQHKLTVGAPVMYTRKFLKCIGASATDPLWFRKGVVTRIGHPGLTRLADEFVQVEWIDRADEETGFCHASCVARVGTIACND